MNTSPGQLIGVLLGTVALMLGGSSTCAADQHFTEVSSAVGIGGQTGLGHAVAWCDIDNDGDQDLAFSNQDSTGFWLYRNDAGGFTDITTAAGLGGIGARKILFAEITGDDQVDLVVRTSITSLWRNNGDGTFANITGASGLSGTALCVNDFDNDGAIDLLTLQSDSLRVHAGNGDGTFVAPATVGGAPDCWTTVCFDYDLDGLTDIYVGTYGTGANQLFHNDGDGTFSELGSIAGVAWTGRAHGLAVGDYDNDGMPDLYVGSYSAPGCVLFHNLGDGTFADVTSDAGVLGRSDTRTVSFTDYDNDGFLDIFASHHDFYTYSNLMWHNNGDGTFTEVGVALGLSGEWVGDYFGVGWTDFNADGATDLFAAGHIDKYVLHRNDECPGNYLMIDLVGVESNRSAIGARATLSTCGRELTQFVIAGSGRQDFNSLTLEFGLADCGEASSLEISWPSGAVQNVDEITANQHVTITEQPAALIFADDFSSGDTQAWSTTVPFILRMTSSEKE
jgi:hypothetical protein